VTVPRVAAGGFKERKWQDKLSAELNKDPFCVRASTLSSEGRKEIMGRRA